MRYVASKAVHRDLGGGSFCPVVDVYGEGADTHAVLRIVPERFAEESSTNRLIWAAVEISALTLADLDRLALEVESARQLMLGGAA